MIESSSSTEQKADRKDQKFLTESSVAQVIRDLTSNLIKSIILWERNNEFRKVARFRNDQIQYRIVTIKKFEREEECEC